MVFDYKVIRYILQGDAWEAKWSLDVTWQNTDFWITFDNIFHKMNYTFALQQRGRHSLQIGIFQVSRQKPKVHAKAIFS